MHKTEATPRHIDFTEVCMFVIRRFASAVARSFAIGSCLACTLACVGDASSEAVQRWRCLGDAPLTGDEPVAVRLVLLDETSEAPVAGAHVAQCTRSDLDCAHPMWAGTSDARGIVNLAIVDEYLEVTAPGYRDTLVMSVGSFDVTRGQRTPLDVHLDLYPTASFDGLVAASGVTPADGTGDIEVLVRDCAYESAGGVVVTLDVASPELVLRYLVNDLPSASAGETDVDSGSALVFNAPPGLHGVAATLAATGAAVAGDDVVVAVIVRPGWITAVAIVPRSVDIRDVEGD